MPLNKSRTSLRCPARIWTGGARPTEPTLWRATLVATVLTLSACERSASQARGGTPAGDPFQALELIRANAPEPAKAFTVPSLTAQPLRLADFRDQVVLLNFWATWCPPCREEMPSMERLYQRYRDRGLAILALSIDTNTGAVAPFVTQFRLTFPIGLDPQSTVAREYNLHALPTTIVIDKAGHLAALAIGMRDWDSPAARGVAETLLKGEVGREGARDDQRRAPLVQDAPPPRGVGQ